MPQVRGTYPDAKLWIVGSHPSEAVMSLAGPGVEVTGAVSSSQLQAHYEAARVAVVPLRFGAGVKLKVVEALHEGLPLVTTPVGAQGLSGLEAVCTVAESEGEMVRAISALLADDNLWHAQSARQLAYAERTFTRRASVEALSSAVRAATRTLKPASLRLRNYETDADRLRTLARDTDQSDVDFIKDVYLGMLGRKADASGAAHYLEEIRSGALTRETLIEAFASSDERKHGAMRRLA